MDVSVTELRANLSRWLVAARDGDEVVVTDRGVPIARLVGIDAASTLDRLTAQGVIARPLGPRVPVDTDRPRPKPKRALADEVSRQRD